MGGFELFFRQLLTIVGYSFPTVLLATLLCWWGLRSKKTGTPTGIAACRSAVVCLATCFVYAVTIFDTPNEFRNSGAGGVVFIAIVGSLIMMVLYPGKSAQPSVSAVAPLAPTTANEFKIGTGSTSAPQSKGATSMQKLNAGVKANWPILIVLSLLACAWMFRFQAVPVASGNSPATYVIDRWTGTTTFYGGTQYYSTRPVAK